MEIHQVTILEEHDTLTIEEISVVCNTQQDFIQALIDEGIIEPIESKQTTALSHDAIDHIRKAKHLHHDLGVNLPGIAIIIELLNRMERN